MMLEGKKRLEIRSQGLHAGLKHAGHHGKIYGAIATGEPVLIETNETWRQLAQFHHHDSKSLPHATTYALPVIEVVEFTSEIPYQHALGSVGTAKYRPPGVFPTKKSSTAASSTRAASSKKKGVKGEVANTAGMDISAASSSAGGIAKPLPSSTDRSSVAASSSTRTARKKRSITSGNAFVSFRVNRAFNTYDQKKANNASKTLHVIVHSLILKMNEHNHSDPLVEL